MQSVLSLASRYAMLRPRLSFIDRIVRLGSLKQLTLGSFLVAMVPLIALLLQSHSDFKTTEQMSQTDIRFVVSVVGGQQQLDSAAIDVERALRQYQIVQNDTAAKLVHSALARFSEALDQVCEQLVVLSCRAPSGLEAYSENALMTQLSATELESIMLRVRELTGQLRRDVDDGISDRLAAQQQDINRMQTRQAWSTAVLVTISLITILLGTLLIVNPVNKLKHIIQILAHQEGRLPPLSTKAPRELIAVEQDLHWLSDRLTQLENLRTALLRHAAHELKTPLASMKEGCSLLSDNLVGELTQTQHEVVKLLSNSTQRLNTLVEKLLDYNLLLQQAQPTLESVEVKGIVSACLNDYALALQHAEVNVNIQCDTLVADQELLRRIFDNLVSNAVAHGAKGRPIDIRVELLEGVAIIDVANRGRKIPPENVACLFEPFIRGEGVRNDNVIGTGLGLSIVSDCARLMHGEVNVVDVDYADVCFRVTLPQ